MAACLWTSQEQGRQDRAGQVEQLERRERRDHLGRIVLCLGLIMKHRDRQDQHLQDRDHRDH